MKKPEWLFVVALLLVGAYFGYRYFSKQDKFDPLQLVPKTAVAIYETKDILQLASKLESSKLWQELKEIDEVELASKIESRLDSLAGRSNRTKKQLIANRTLISLHVTGSESSGLIFYLPLGAGSRAILEELLVEHTGEKSQFLTRVYAGLTIHELASGDIRLSYINHKNYMIVSTVGYLVEDVVRNIIDKFADNFLTSNNNLLKVPKLSNDAGNLYVNGALLLDFYNTLMPAMSPQAGSLAESLFLDINLSEEEVFLSGFLFEDKPNEFASIFIDQEAGFSPSLRLVPGNAAVVMAINVSDVQGWYERWLAKFSKGKNSDKASSDGMSFVKSIDGEITLATFSANNKSRQDKLMLIKLADKEGMLNILNRKAEEIAINNNDTVYYEHFADFTIGLIEEEEYVKSIFGEPFNGFSSTFFMIYEDYLLLSSSSERLKKWWADIDDNLVWGRSADKNSFIDEKLGEFSFALIYTNPWSWNFALDKFNANQASWWQKNELAIKQFGTTSYQFSNLDNRFYTELTLSYNPQQVETGQQQLSELVLSLVNNKLIRKPKLVKNHTNNKWEVLLQDSAFNLSLLDNKGEFLWQDSMTSPIVGEIYQIDYFKNRKLQYFFATDSSINIIDRNGKNIEGYPVHFPDFQITNLLVIDYDHSRNYRFLITDNTGNLRMFNEKSEPLDSWNPLSLNSTLSDQVFHVRVRGKDRIIIGLQNGIIEMRNRRAVRQPGFPVDLQFNLDNPLHFNVGSTFDDSRFTTISKEGMVVEFDLNGKVYARRQFPQFTGSSQYYLVIDPAQNDFVIARQDLNRLAILDKNGDVIFEKDYQSSSRKEVQYYSLGVDKQLYIVRNTETGKVYLYNKEGSLINSSTVLSDYPISVVYRKSQSKCYIYTGKDQSVAVNYFSF